CKNYGAKRDRGHAPGDPKNPFALIHRMPSLPACTRCDPPIRSLRSHPDKDLVFSKGQHRAATRSLQVQDHTGTVLQPQMPVPRGAQAGFAGALRVPAWKIRDAGELTDGAGRADFLDPATAACNGTEHFERIGSPLELQGAGAATEAGNKSSVIVTLP